MWRALLSCPKCEVGRATPGCSELIVHSIAAMAKTDRRGNVLDIGHRQRTVSPALLRALQLRDRRCRFPGCNHAVFVDAHHIRHWAHGGATALGNLVLVCHAHHVSLHEGGFAVRLEDGRPIFVDPTEVEAEAASAGRLLTERD